jgi:TRAP-type C4-dicarboxylate transport system permease small subunit
MTEQHSGTARRILHAINLGEKWLSVVAFSALVLIIFGDVVSRELTGAGLYWATQSGVWANVLIVMAGFGLASADGAHLRPRFADTWLPLRWLPTLETAQHAVMSLFCAAACWLASGVVLGSWQLGEVSLDLFLPIWPVQIFLPLALSLAALRHGIFALVAELRPQETAALAISVAGRDDPA